MILRSKIFYTDTYKGLEQKIKDLLNQQTDFLSPRTIDSPRAVGDAIADVLSDHFDKILANLAKEYSAAFARRAMADLAFTDQDDFYYVVDVKTHRLDTAFNMPKLTSVRRLARLYEDDKNYFVILKINYRIEDTKVVVDRIVFVPIEFLGWDCLTLGALGWGQIQIANANIVNLLPQNSRKEWMIEMCNHLLEFYPREIVKINERMDYFRKIRTYWQEKEE